MKELLDLMRRTVSRQLLYATVTITLSVLNLSAIVVSKGESGRVWAAANCTNIPQIKVVNYVTWWSLDPEGYHPAILLKLENNSGHDLTGQQIHFQGRFLDLRTTDITVARKDTAGGFAPHQRMLVWLRAPDAYELPINVERWPRLECKAMCRIGDVGDDGTQTLVITEVENEAKTDDDARDQMDKLKEFSQIAYPTSTRRTK